MPILWCFWLERNARSFEGAVLSAGFLCDRIMYLAFFWAEADGGNLEVTSQVGEIQLKWANL